MGNKDIRISKDTKIYVYCPGGVVTGGVELLHQLVSLLNDLDRKAYIVYLGSPESKCVPKEYIGYNLQIADSIEDSKKNIEVIPETLTHLLKKNSSTQKILWWLSVDNFFSSSQLNSVALLDLFKFDKKLALKIAKRRLVKSITKFRNFFKGTISLKQMSQFNAISAYQSEYAHRFLEQQGFKVLYPLKDYINIEHYSGTQSAKGKDNIVLFNPKKGWDFTKRLISFAPEVNWMPIENLTRQEAADLMARSKLYIDFGNHPGKDRLPRECALHGCCIITGRRGAAKFYEDLMIPDEYKFLDIEQNIPKIVEKIKDILENYSQHTENFALYRASILKEREEFETQVRNLFDL